MSVKLPGNTKDSYDEEDWSDVNACTTYEKSKTLAEKAAWDFHQSLPEGERFDLITINPTLILGPVLIEADFSSGVLI